MSKDVESFQVQLMRVRPALVRGVPRTRFEAQVTGKLGKDATLVGVKKVVSGWACERWPGFVRAGEFEKDEFRFELPGTVIASMTLEVDDTIFWSFRAQHPDLESAGRTWVVDMGIAAAPEGLVIGVRSLSTTLATSTAMPPKRTVPALANRLARRFGIEIDGRLLTHQPWAISGHAKVKALAELIYSPSRTLPVVLVTQKQPGELSDPATFAIDPHALAARVIGAAHVATIDYESNFELTDLVGRDGSAFNGSVRTYRPGFGRPGFDIFDHPLILAARIEAWKPREDQQSSEPWPSGASGVQRLIADLALRESVSGTGWRERMFSISDLEAHALGLKLSSASDDADLLRARVSQLECERDEVLRWAADLEKERDVERERSEKLERDVNSLRYQNESFKARRGVPVEQLVQRPATYGELAKWVHDGLAGRLVLSARAEDAVKAAEFQDVALVYDALELLATEYRNMRLANPEERTLRQEALQARLGELGLSDSGSIAESTRGEFKELYEITWPPGGKAKRVLDRHLAKGKNKEERYTLRIYYFWDEESSQVVVGHLPSHLRNRKT